MPSQDMVLGCYYLTLNNIKNLLGCNHYFANLEDVISAYYQDRVELHATIWVRYQDSIMEPKTRLKKITLNDNSYIEYYENLQIRRDVDSKIIVQYIQTTPGRVILNYTIHNTLKLFN